MSSGVPISLREVGVVDVVGVMGVVGVEGVESLNNIKGYTLQITILHPARITR